MDRRSVLRGMAGLAASGGLRRLVGTARAETTIQPDRQDALLVIDVQNCFMPGGELPVPGGDQVVAVINRVGRAFANVVETQVWHASNDITFASAHPGKQPFQTIKLPYGSQMLWPDYCVQDTPGAAIVSGLSLPQTQLILRKGYHPNVASYSAFNEADGTPTGLAGYLNERGIARLFLAGLTTEYAVSYSATDARKARFVTYVIEDACRGFNRDGAMAQAWANMLAVGVHRIQSADIVVPS